MIQIDNYSNDVEVTVECSREEKISNGFILHKVPSPPYLFKANFHNYAMDCLLEYELSEYTIIPLIPTKEQEGIKSISVKQNRLIIRYIENGTLFIFEGVIRKEGDYNDT